MEPCMTSNVKGPTWAAYDAALSASPKAAVVDEGASDREPSMALSVLDDAAQRDGWADARHRFHANDIDLIVEAMLSYADERIAALATPSTKARQAGGEVERLREA